MHPIYRWAAVSLAFVPAPAVAVPDPLPPDPLPPDPLPVASNDILAGSAIGNPTGQGWLGLKIRPFSVAHLIGVPRTDGGAAARSLVLGAAPEPLRLISFARTSIDAPTSSRLNRDAPWVSRLPGKQLKDYEAGLRTTLADGAIALQAGVSYNRYRNLQTSLRQGARLMTANAGRVKTYGVEGLVRWAPSDRINLFATYAWREGWLKNQFHDGKSRLSPDRSAAVGAVLLLPLGQRRLAFIPIVAWQSAMGLGADLDGQGSIALVNAQLGYSVADNLEIDALAANLLNRRYARPVAVTDRPMIAGEPRVFGVRARLRFGARH